VGTTTTNENKQGPQPIKRDHCGHVQADFGLE